MSESQYTRFVRLRPDADRGLAHNDGTRCVGPRQFARVSLVDHRSLFNHHQLRLHQVVREYPRPGVAVFALHHNTGFAGHLWLEATARLRAGTIGRHSEVDLFLPDDEELSLRHLLVLVKQGAGGLRLRIADLATSAGFQSEEGGVLRAVEANGVLVLRAASYSFFAIPTGGQPPWNRHADDPWRTLPRRVVVAEPRTPRSPPAWRPGARVGETSISFVNGPEEPGPEPALAPGEPVAGQLAIANGGLEERLSVGAKALERGIILGRYSRCSGDTSVMTGAVSRVHAVLISVEGLVHIIDAGSTNGVLVGEAQVKCAPVEPGAAYSLGTMRVRWDPTH